ncbi:hypothetical protein SDC9_195935 [bioreactor metagenome]|uniref:Uncharacterized protein n=1 Tax=bioreactor metagenome TaxID=1076179 RepID=A0A645IAN6_9ZZZZ
MVDEQALLRHIGKPALVAVQIADVVQHPFADAEIFFLFPTLYLVSHFVSSLHRS